MKIIAKKMSVTTYGREYRTFWKKIPQHLKNAMNDVHLGKGTVKLQVS